MSRWTCPKCAREFGRAGQSHVCFPALTPDDTFARHPREQRAAYDAVMTHLQDLGPVHEDAVEVGVFLKHHRKIAELRPMKRWLALYVCLPRRVTSSRVTRTFAPSGGRTWHVIRLHAADDVDDQVKSWLSEAYFA